MFFSLIVLSCGAQQKASNQTSSNYSNSCYWQQHVDYSMEIEMNVNTFRYNGKQTLIYTNNSPDTLNRVYYHLYFNAFQPGSEMDMRLRSIEDPDGRMVTDGQSREDQLNALVSAVAKSLSFTFSGPQDPPPLGAHPA